MPRDQNDFRKRLLLHLASKPGTLFPFVAGVTVLLGTWAVGPLAAGIPIFAGLCCLLGSAGHFLTNLLVGNEKAAKKVLEEIRDEAHQAREKELDALEEELVRDGDPRTERYLHDLRTLTARLIEENASFMQSNVDVYTALDLVSKVEELFNLSVQALAKTLKLWETAEVINSPKARIPIMEERERLIKDVQKSIEKLGTILVDVQKIEIDEGENYNLAQIRQDLDRSIHIARDARSKVNEWEKRFEERGMSTFNGEGDTEPHLGENPPVEDSPLADPQRE